MNPIYSSSPTIDHSSGATELRVGKWTLEEKTYADALAEEFEVGTLAIDDGVSMRRFLSSALNCSAKRISKKYEGTEYNGKMLYKKDRAGIAPEEAHERRLALQGLEQKYQDSLKVLKMVEDSKHHHLASSRALQARRGLGAAFSTVAAMPPPRANAGLDLSPPGTLMSPSQVLERMARLEAHLVQAQATSSHLSCFSTAMLESFLRGEETGRSSSAVHPRSGAFTTPFANRVGLLSSARTNPFVPSTYTPSEALEFVLSSPPVAGLVSMAVPPSNGSAHRKMPPAFLPAHISAFGGPADRHGARTTARFGLVGDHGGLLLSKQREQSAMVMLAALNRAEKGSAGVKRESEDGSLQPRNKFPRLL